jgi:hypothetical protein
MFKLVDREKRVREVMFVNMLEAYQRWHSNWLEEPALQKAIWIASVCCWQSLALITITTFVCSLLFIIFPPLPFAALSITVVLGGVAEITFLYFSFKDDEWQTKVVANLLADEVTFTLATIRDKNLKVKLYQAFQYWSLIDDLLNKLPRGSLHDCLIRTTREAIRWLQVVYNLAKRIDNFRLNQVIRRDLQTISGVIQNYEQKLSQKCSPEIRHQLEQTLANRQQQWQVLQKLQNDMTKASYQLDNTIAALGTIYTQLLLVSHKGGQGHHLSRWQKEISEQVQQLQDLIAAMDEVYNN